ncbi:MAG: MobF family relaxase, partial [Acidimicrobiales bacterium]
MLSIGKLTPGRAGYYSAQLPGGADEYYTRNTGVEQPAVWLGSAAGRLGLAGPVAAEQFRAVLDACHPVTGEPLGIPRTTARRLAGFDLCLSAPKSVSVAWALAPPEVADRIAAAHDRAVAQSVEAFEVEVVRARRGKRAATLIDTDGVAAAAFGHRSSRRGDPQIHTHVVVPNLTVDGTGRWSALAGDRVYRWAKTLGYLYQAALRAELAETLDIAWGPVRNGSAEIAGVDSRLVEAFSKRRAEILDALRAVGGRSAQAAQTATLATRPAKDHTIDIDTLRDRWHDEAAALGCELPHVRQVGPDVRLAAHTKDLAPELFGPEGLTANASTFDRRDVLRAVAAAHPDGIRVSGARAGTDRLLARPEVVALGSDGPAGPRYSTAELVGVEARLVDRARRQTDAHLGIAGHDAVRAALAERPSLTGEQRQMVASLTASGAGVEVVVGRAGSGKTFALDAARAAWEASGHQVIGCALAARAAVELQAGSGIASGTVDRLVADLDRPGPLSLLRPRTVVVVDEAAMIGTRKLARLLEHAEAREAKVVLVGDHRQLPEIAAGGAFAALTHAVATTELAGNSRQTQAWERTALSELRAGSVAAGVDA